MGLAINFSADRKQLGKADALKIFGCITQPAGQARITPQDLATGIRGQKAAAGILEEVFEILL